MPLGITIAPTQSDLQAALRGFLTRILPADLTVIGALDNRVAEPQIGNFVIVTPIRFVRQDTNLDIFQDSTFYATVDGDQMTVTGFDHGRIELGALLTGAGVPADTLVLDGPAEGLEGVYTLNSAISIPDTQAFHAGAKILQINARSTIQLDFHSDDYSAAQNAQTAALMLRDLYATDYFAGLAAPRNRITPMHADEAAQRPFVNDQRQYEWRWVVEAIFQVNQRIVVAQEFAQEVDIDLNLVDTVDATVGPALGPGPG